MKNMSENSTFTTSNLLFQPCDIIIAISTVRFIFLLPLSILVIYVGLKKWCQHHSFKAESNFDIFTYHLVTMEFLWVLGYPLEMCGHYYGMKVLLNVSVFMCSYAYYGEIFFHTLICAERYIAVVLPITYMRMKNTYGLRVRTISIVCVWLLSFGIICLIIVELYKLANFLLICILGFAIILSSYCSFSVLCVLIRPGPGESNKGMMQFDQSKQRLFYTIAAISSLQWIWFFCLLASITMVQFFPQDPVISCFVRGFLGFCNLPYCVVMPLMYLHRAGILLFYKS